MWPALERTLGVPLFQEQLMQLAVDVAGFGAGEADELRRAMGSKRSVAKMERLKDRLYQGMKQHHGITGDIADRIFEKMLAFANYGFAESHALAFAGIVFHSAWLKLHHPAAFCAGLLRAQPMGFYSPQSLVADARRHGVTVQRPDINASQAKATLERSTSGTLDVRLGLDSVRTIGTELAEQLAARRPVGGWIGMDQLTAAVTLTSAQAEALATAGALDRLVPTATDEPAGAAAPVRRRALWAAGAAASNRAGMLAGSSVGLEAPPLPGMSEIEVVAADMWATGITPDGHPVEFSRDRLAELGAVTIADLAAIETGTRVLVPGAVTHRQRPATATGVTFINLEDETGMANVIVSAGAWRKYKGVARGARGLLVRGILERQGEAMSVLADRMTAISLIASTGSRDFR